jgi:hypothetical protein
MNRLLLSAALVVAFSVPAWVGTAGGKFKQKQRYVTPAPEQQLKSYKERRKSDPEKVDPYWTPCNYQSVECGGGGD